MWLSGWVTRETECEWVSKCLCRYIICVERKRFRDQHTRTSYGTIEALGMSISCAGENV